MAKILFEVEVRWPAKLFAKVQEQADLRTQHGERSFNVHIDNNARHVAYVFLEWESLPSAQRFLESKISHDLVADWPFEKVLGAIPLYDLGERLKDIELGRNAV